MNMFHSSTRLQASWFIGITHEIPHYLPLASHFVVKFSSLVSSSTLVNEPNSQTEISLNATTDGKLIEAKWQRVTSWRKPSYQWDAPGAPLSVPATCYV